MISAAGEDHLGFTAGLVAARVASVRVEFTEGRPAMAHVAHGFYVLAFPIIDYPVTPSRLIARDAQGRILEDCSLVEDDSHCL
ncbi:MAG TPA: hypothetical protein VM030_04600 [Acidimicrobiales bacterium]|nr:hypothetical protein [Acidimicrobiales bacterium]